MASVLSAKSAWMKGLAMKDFTIEVKTILAEYAEDVQRASDTACEQIAKEAVAKLKATSPKRTKGRTAGRYARGWSIKRDPGTRSVTVYNKTDPQLTHLLENSHVIRNKKGTYGRTTPKKHIEPVEQWAKEALPKEIERLLR